MLQFFFYIFVFRRPLSHSPAYFHTFFLRNVLHVIIMSFKGKNTQIFAHRSHYHHHQHQCVWSIRTTNEFFFSRNQFILSFWPLIRQSLCGCLTVEYATAISRFASQFPNIRRLNVFTLCVWHCQTAPQKHSQHTKPMRSGLFLWRNNNNIQYYFGSWKKESGGGNPLPIIVL